MSEPESVDAATQTAQALAAKIARLVEERGWNQEEFARIAGINRQTARQILLEGGRTLRNATISACAKALGLAVNELRTVPLERLLPRMNGALQAAPNDPIATLREQATQPELLAWLERNPERARQLSTEEADELVSLQQEDGGGPLRSPGVDHVVLLIERKRRLIEQMHAIAGTEYIELLEKLVALMYEKIQPYRDRV